MTFIQHNGIRYFQFDTLQTRHALFTRRGGVSPNPWGSLNVGGTVGDDLGRVRENRVLSFQALGCAPESIFDVWQVHSSDVVCARAPRPVDESYRQADIILTDRKVSGSRTRITCVPSLIKRLVPSVVSPQPSPEYLCSRISLKSLISNTRAMPPRQIN